MQQKIIIIEQKMIELNKKTEENQTEDLWKSWIELLTHMCLEGAESLREDYAYKKIDQSSKKL